MRKHYAACMAVLLFCLAAFAQAVAADDKQPKLKMTRDEKRLEQELRRIDRESKEAQGEQRVLAQLSSDLGISEDRLRAQKQSSNLSYGNLYIANSLAKATGTSFENIVSMHHNGKAWGQIAQENNVKLGEVVSNARRNHKAIEAQRRNEVRRMEDRPGQGAGPAKGQSATRPAGPGGPPSNPGKPPKPPGKPH